jgi:hypothetical protein
MIGRSEHVFSVHSASAYRVGSMEGTLERTIKKRFAGCDWASQTRTAAPSARRTLATSARAAEVGTPLWLEAWMEEHNRRQDRRRISVFVAVDANSNISISQRYVHPSEDAVLNALARLGEHNSGHSAENVIPVGSGELLPNLPPKNSIVNFR